MKKVVILMAFFAIAASGIAQSAYELAVKKNIDSLYQSFGTGRLQEPVNTFERLAAADSSRWEPLYYAAYGYCMMSLREQDSDKKDALCDRGQMFLDRAIRLSPNESEIYVLQGFLYNMRLLVSPMMRASKYMSLIHESYNTAEKMNAANPRVNYMRAQMIMGSPSFMGGGKDKALPEFEKAKQKYDIFMSNNILAPRWGKEDCLKKIEECKKQ